MKQESGYYCQTIMNKTFQEKVDAIKKSFDISLSSEEKYHILIEMGSRLPPFPPHFKTPQNLVPGCQSNLYLHSYLDEGRLFFLAASDALISAGLAALLIAAYSGETPEAILTNPPDFLTSLGLHASLSQNRSNGLNHIHLRIKQEAVKSLLTVKNS